MDVDIRFCWSKSVRRPGSFEPQHYAQVLLPFYRQTDGRHLHARREIAKQRLGSRMELQSRRDEEEARRRGVERHFGK